jgi:hypothetical protein
MRLERECWRRWGLARIELCGCAALGFKAQAAAKQDCLLAGRGPPDSRGLTILTSLVLAYGIERYQSHLISKL